MGSRDGDSRVVGSSGGGGLDRWGQGLVVVWGWYGQRGGSEGVVGITR